MSYQVLEDLYVKKSQSFKENVSFTFLGVICPVKTPSRSTSIVYYTGAWHFKCYYSEYSVQRSMVLSVINYVAASWRRRAHMLNDLNTICLIPLSSPSSSFFFFCLEIHNRFCQSVWRRLKSRVRTRCPLLNKTMRSFNGIDKKRWLCCTFNHRKWHSSWRLGDGSGSVLPRSLFSIC